MKNKNIILKGLLFWFWQLTWGGLFTIPGLLITGFCILIGGKPHKNGYSYIVEIGGNWGGISLGATALCGRYSDRSPRWFAELRRHEFGHSVQQLIFGPLHIFVVGIPSLTRSWYFTLTPQKMHQEYDYVWFEYTASKWGFDWINKIENEDMKYTYTRVKVKK